MEFFVTINSISGAAASQVPGVDSATWASEWAGITGVTAEQVAGADTSGDGKISDTEAKAFFKSVESGKIGHLTATEKSKLEDIVKQFGNALTTAANIVGLNAQQQMAQQGQDQLDSLQSMADTVKGSIDKTLEMGRKSASDATQTIQSGTDAITQNQKALASSMKPSGGGGGGMPDLSSLGG